MAQSSSDQKKDKMAQELVPVTAATPLKVVAPTNLVLPAPGFRFYPTDEELVVYYLRRKACGKPIPFEVVADLNIYGSEPWELHEFSPLKTRDPEMYFFCRVDKKGSSISRATRQGFWKQTGIDRPVLHSSQTVGMKKTLYFHINKAPHGEITKWIMHEYRLVDKELGKALPQDAVVLCRIYQNSGPAPLVDEDWDDGAALLVPGGEADEMQVGGDDVQQAPVQVQERMIQALFPFSMAGGSPLGEREARGTQAEPKENDSCESLQNLMNHVSMEREALKMELMRAQSIMNGLLSRTHALEKENDEMKTSISRA